MSIMLCYLCVATVLFIALILWMENALRKRRLPNIEQKHVFITGCDSGFGLKLVEQLDSIGVFVFASCLTEEGENRVRKLCSSRVTTLRLDVTNEQSIKDAVRTVRTRLKDKDLWGLVNNAGLQIINAPLELHSRQAIEKTLQVNLLGVLYVTQAFLPLIRASRGRIVTISSDAAIISWPCRVPYNISKCGVESMSGSLRKELYYTGVSAHCVEPGAFKTSIIDPEEMCSTLQKAFDSVEPEVRRFYGEGWLEKWKKKFWSIPPTQNPDLSPVTNAVEHALFSAYPKARYRCGRDCRFVFWPISLLPDWFSDWYYAMPPPDGAS